MNKCPWGLLHLGSCTSTQYWHLTLNRRLTPREWDAYSAGGNKCFSEKFQDYDPTKCLALITSIAPDVFQVGELARKS